MFQPWKALTTIINLFLTGKTSGFEIPRALVLQILWGIVTQSNIDYAERIWEEFTQSIHTFIEDKRYLSRHTTGKKSSTLIVILSIRFTKLIIHHLQRRHKFHPRLDSPLYLPNENLVLGYLKFSAKGSKREVFRMPIPGSLMTSDIQTASYYQEYLASVAKHRKYLAGETGSHLDSPASMPTDPAKGTKREVFGMPIPGSLITTDIQEASYYQEYLAKVAQHRRYLASETGSDRDFPAPKPMKPAGKPKIWESQYMVSYFIRYRDFLHRCLSASPSDKILESTNTLEDRKELLQPG
nr:hypothetical protein [Tanacetum cinerariifolium]